MPRTIVLLALGLLVSPVWAGPRTRKVRSSRPRSIRNLLRGRTVSLELKEASLDAFVKVLRAASGINIVVRKHRIEKDGQDPDSIRITLHVRKVRILDALRLVLEPNGLGYSIKGNVLRITSKKDALCKPVLRIYSVAHLLVPIRDFPARDMNLYPSNVEPPEPPEPEVQHTYESSEELAELVRQFTGRGTWEDQGVSITVFRHHLFIRTYPAVHAEIARLLARLPH